MAATKTNSMQAVLDAAAKQTANDEPSKTKTRKTKAAPTKQAKPSRAATTLIGGHFSPEVSKQLAIIAAEEGTTKQALLSEALNMLFVKKGKAKIAEL